MPNQAAGNRVADRIEAERKVRATRTVPEAETGANLVRQVVASGTLHMRSHVDIDNQLGLRNLHEILKVRERFRDLVTIQIVAFPQSGILRSPGTAALLDAAIAEGADLLGGLDPVGIDGDLDGHLDAIFGIAERRGVGVDIHLHDSGESGIHQLTAIAHRTEAAGLNGRVAVSHAFALGSVPTDLAERTADLLAEAGVAIMSHGPGGAHIPPLKLLHDHGVEVFGGSDNIRDAWSPFGNGDMLERAMMIGYRANFRHDEELALAFDMVTAARRARAGHHALRHRGRRPGRFRGRRSGLARRGGRDAAQAQIGDQSRSHCRQGWRTGPLNFGDRQWRRVRPCSGWSGPASSTARPASSAACRSCSTARGRRWSARTAPASRPC